MKSNQNEVVKWRILSLAGCCIFS